MTSLIFFSTSSCGYCRPIRTMIENLKANYEDDNRIDFTNIVIDKDVNGIQLAKEHGVNAVPTILIIVNQEEQDRLIGSITNEKLVNAIERYL